MVETETGQVVHGIVTNGRYWLQKHDSYGWHDVAEIRGPIAKQLASEAEGLIAAAQRVAVLEQENHRLRILDRNEAQAEAARLGLEYDALFRESEKRSEDMQTALDQRDAAAQREARLREALEKQRAMYEAIISEGWLRETNLNTRIKALQEFARHHGATDVEALAAVPPQQAE